VTKKLSEELDEEAFAVRDGEGFSELSRNKLANRLQEYAKRAALLERTLDRQYEGRKRPLMPTQV